MSELLAFEGVHSGYGAARVLHGIDISIGAHERVALVGRNGVGKTTVVNTFLGIARLNGGEIRLGGRASHDLRRFSAARSGIAVVPQGRCIIPNLTVEENLLLGAAVDRPGSWNLDKVYELFPILRERRGSAGTALSGGQQQMLAIGRALMANPSLLVLDEPSEGLAPVIVDELGVIFCQLAESGTGLLLIEQHLGLITKVATRYYALSKGTVVDQGDLSTLSIEELKRHVTI